MKVIQFKACHMEKLMENGNNCFLKGFLTPSILSSLETNDCSYTAVDENGEVIACGGVVSHWPGRGEAWAVLSDQCKKEFLSLHNIVRKFLSVSPFRRVEAVVAADFEQGHRWMKALGFRMEAPRLSAYLDGKDYSLYARVI